MTGSRAGIITASYAEQEKRGEQKWISSLIFRIAGQIGRLGMEISVCLVPSTLVRMAFNPSLSVSQDQGQLERLNLHQLLSSAIATSFIFVWATTSGSSLGGIYYAVDYVLRISPPMLPLLVAPSFPLYTLFRSRPRQTLPFQTHRVSEK
ncbi:hypothetical protein B0T10DRAFT_115245 [Thelonectria olida]|uniref:Uncharacterized protein n=1 Tax=Thelonectria olida TaxID=1576542 RepID=A0A9P9AVV1_9HYPO|nr:hypothetical protein B0T10DRAFT_115245 [Thelonectria olida]